jgi:hypothetical protein
VDTVVTCYHGRETDKKTCHGRDIRRRIRTTVRRRRETDKVVCLFIYIYKCGVCRHVLFFFFFLMVRRGWLCAHVPFFSICCFFTNLNWAKAVWAGPGAWGQTASALLREPAIEARHARARLRTGTCATAETVWGVACVARSTQETVWGAARGITAIFFCESRDRVQEFKAGRSGAPPRETPASEGSDLRSFF